jgi:anthranilate synthase component 1
MKDEELARRLAPSRNGMRYRPTPEELVELARGHSLVPVCRQLVGDTLTPVTAFRKIQDGDWAFLFESVVGGERLGRYSFLGSGPFLHFEAHGQDVRIEDRITGKVQKLTHDDPLRLLEETVTRYRAPHLNGLPRFLGGAVGYAGYDTVRYVERLDHPPPDDRGLPDLCFALAW